MATGVRFITKRFLIIVNIIVVILFLISCLVSYLDPAKWWFISVLSLAFPVLLVITGLFFIFWTVVKWRIAVLSLIVLVIGWRNIKTTIAFNRDVAFDNKKKRGQLRLVTWNVARFIELKRNNNKGSHQRLRMMELLKDQDADIICLQEFFSSTNPEYYNNIIYIQKILNYPYYYFTYESDGEKHYYSSIIFSRIPMLDTGRTYYPKPGIREVLIHADFKVNNDTFRVYTTHLQSVQFQKTDYDKIEKIQTVQDSLLQNSRTIFSKLKWASIYRSGQAKMARQTLDNSPYPVLFTGDLNDVPDSYTYFTVRGDRQDAFLEKGSGIGRTFSGISPTLRIDYIFADKRFSVTQFKRIVRDLSDHYMLVADIELPQTATAE